MNEVSIKKVEYRDWKNCIEISNGIVDIIATTDVGPRIIRFGFVGKENMFWENPDDSGQTGGDEFRLYGGHRLWHSPEDRERTYSPDNSKVTWKKKKYGIVLTQDVEPLTHIRKEMEISLMPDSAKVSVLHRLTNEGVWDVELSVWCLSMMAPGGLEVIPLNTSETDLLPNNVMSLWPYTKLNDKRVKWGENYITLSQDKKASAAFKIGLYNEEGWAAYINNDQLFVKQYDHEADFEYPDFNSSYETYTNSNFLEMETLSPIVLLGSGETIEHMETWSLYDNVEKPKNEKDIDNNIIPLIGK